MYQISSRHLCIYLYSILGFLFVSDVRPQSNFFREYKKAYNNQGWGQYCPDLTEKVPSCGWKLILTSPTVITKVEVWDSTYTKIDNNTYILTCLSYRGDLRNVSPPCYNINYEGPFGNIVPSIYITWYCVCDSSTGGQCQMVSPTTTTTPATTESINQLLGDDKPWSVSEQRRTDFCYLGQRRTPASKPIYIVDCASICAGLSKCTGINFRASAKQCDLVYEDIKVISNLLEQEDGCYFWIVINKF